MEDVDHHQMPMTRDKEDGVPSRRYGVFVAGLVAALLPTALMVMAAPSAQADTAATVTTTSLRVEPGTSVTVQTAVSLVAEVSPATASGFVVFSGRGKTLASAPVVNGRATVGNVYLGLGLLDVVATFTPNDSSVFTPSMSAPMTVAVREVPNVWVTDVTGAIIAGSAPVTAGRSYTINVSGFPAGADVEVQLAGRALQPGIRADSSGGGSLGLALAASFPPGVYELEAAAGSVTTAVVFYVVPTAVPAPTTTPGPTEAAVTAPIGVVVPAAPLPSTGGLASTGADPVGPGLAGILFVVMGLLLWRVGSSPAPHYARRH